MVLFERMNGHILESKDEGTARRHTYASRQANSGSFDDSPAAGAEYWTDDNPGHEQAAQPGYPEPDIEAIIAQRVAEALARQQSYQEGETGMQAHRRGQMPAYGNSSPRIQRVGGLAPAA
jgi:hypothetical protein